MVLRLRSTVCVTVSTSCELYVLERRALDAILEYYPSKQCAIVAEISARMEAATASHDVSFVSLS